MQLLQIRGLGSCAAYLSQGTAMHALAPCITVHVVCSSRPKPVHQQISNLRGGEVGCGVRGGAGCGSVGRAHGGMNHDARLQHGEVRMWCNGTSVHRAVVRLHEQSSSSLPCLPAYLHGVAHDS